MLLNCGVGEDSWESLRLQGDPTSQSQRKSVLNIHWKDWCWSSNTLATWCEELTHWKRPWCWEKLKSGGEGDDRGWDGWMASPTRWTWVWVSSGSWWWTGKPGVLQSMGSQRVRLDWVIELTDVSIPRERDSEELCHLIIEAENFHNLLSASWWWRHLCNSSLSLKARELGESVVWIPAQGQKTDAPAQACRQKAKGANSLFLRFLFQALSDLMTIRHTEKGNVRYHWVHPLKS